MNTLHTFFRTDFSESADFLAAQVVGPLSEDDAVSFAALMGSADASDDGKGGWTATGEGEFSLAGAEIIYAGVNDNDLPTNPLFNHVVGLRLAPGSDGVPRRTYLHFNAPTE